MNCDITKNYLKERHRMTKGCEEECRSCPFELRNNGHSIYCRTFEEKYPEEAIKIVQRWSNEHPIVTRLEKYIQIIKDTFGEEVTIEYDDCPPVPCDDSKDCEQCRKWWNEPYEKIDVK